MFFIHVYVCPLLLLGYISSPRFIERTGEGIFVLRLIPKWLLCRPAIYNGCDSMRIVRSSLMIPPCFFSSRSRPVAYTEFASV